MIYNFIITNLGQISVEILLINQGYHNYNMHSYYLQGVPKKRFLIAILLH